MGPKHIPVKKLWMADLALCSRNRKTNKPAQYRGQGWSSRCPAHPMPQIHYYDVVRPTLWPFISRWHRGLRILFPASRQQRRRKSGTQLVAANGTKIATYCKQLHILQFAKHAKFQQEFWIADLTQPTLGADCFIKQRLEIDLANKRLVSLDGKTTLKASYSSSKQLGLHKIHSEFEAVLGRLPWTTGTFIPK